MFTISIMTSLFLGVIASALLRLAFHHCRVRQWEAFLANLVLGTMLAGAALAPLARIAGF